MKKALLSLSLMLTVTMNFAQDLQKFSDKKSGKYGYSEGKKKIIPAQYDEAHDFDKQTGQAMVKLNGKWGKIDKSGNTVIPFEYDEIGNTYEGAARARKGTKMGLIDNNGKEITPLRFDGMRPTPYGSDYFVWEDKKWGLIDKAGKEIIPTKYDKITQTHVNPAKYQALAGSETHVFNEKGEFLNADGTAFQQSSSSSSSSSKSQSDKCNYKCQKCSKVAQGKCNPGNTGITTENCLAQQPDPKGPRKNHEWRKQ